MAAAAPMPNILRPPNTALLSVSSDTAAPTANNATAPLSRHSHTISLEFACVRAWRGLPDTSQQPQRS